MNYYRSKSNKGTSTGSRPYITIVVLGLWHRIFPTRNNNIGNFVLQPPAIDMGGECALLCGHEVFVPRKKLSASPKSGRTVECLQVCSTRPLTSSRVLTYIKHLTWPLCQGECPFGRKGSTGSVYAGACLPKSRDCVNLMKPSVHVGLSRVVGFLY